MIKIRTTSSPVVRTDIDKIIEENKWAQGVGTWNGTKRDAQRLRTLEGYKYRIDGKLVEKPELFMPSDYLDWRDG